MEKLLKNKAPKKESLFLFINIVFFGDCVKNRKMVDVTVFFLIFNTKKVRGMKPFFRRMLMTLEFHFDWLLGRILPDCIIKAIDRRLG
ncbi:MAG: hypothetical protein Q8L09_02290 [Candidatus Moranbacteria bacterium]|nr:hypothetical protein [Candidatus Moranbacteria bacterium]